MKMRLPKRGQKGFTLIELLIVVAILGVLAAVVIPNIGQFIGAGTEEAKETELSTIQASVHAMMVDNEIAVLLQPVSSTPYENDMSVFPDLSVAATDKLLDPNGDAYTVTTDKDGYLLYQHDIDADGTQNNLVNYVATQTTAYWYSVDSSGTVSQWDNEDGT